MHMERLCAFGSRKVTAFYNVGISYANIIYEIQNTTAVRIHRPIPCLQPCELLLFLCGRLKELSDSALQSIHNLS